MHLHLAKLSWYVSWTLLVSGYSFKCAENWRRRTEIVSYCVEVVDKSIDVKRQVIEEEDAHSRRSTQAALYSDQVKVYLLKILIHHDLIVSAATTSTQ